MNIYKHNHWPSKTNWLKHKYDVSKSNTDMHQIFEDIKTVNEQGVVTLKSECSQ